MNYSREEYLLLHGMDKELAKFLKGKNVYIAGGAVTSIFSGVKINDYDLYFLSLSNYSEVLAYFDNEKDHGFERIIATDNAITYRKEKKSYQLICMEEMMGELSNIVCRFDFTICMAGYNFYPGSFYLKDEFLYHLAQKRLVFNISSGYPLSALFRIRKFLNRGFTVSGSEIIKLGLCIHQLKIETYKDLRKQLLGIDTLFLKELTDSLLMPDFAEKQYDFDRVMEMVDEYLLKHYSKLYDLEGGEGEENGNKNI